MNCLLDNLKPNPIRTEVSMLKAMVIIALFSLAGLCSGQCTKDVDCKGNRICVNGQCVDSGTAPSVPIPAARPEGEASKRGGVVAVSVEPLGIVEYGPTIMAEFGRRAVGFVRLRFANLGILPYVLASNSTDDFIFGIGAAAGFRYYFDHGGDMRGFRIGGSLEYLYIKTEDNEGTNDEYLTHALLPNFDVGYRWIFGNGFILSAGAIGGWEFPIRTTSKNKVTGGPAVYKNSFEASPIGLLTCEVGYLF
jgi:hypothetical protein